MINKEELREVKNTMEKMSGSVLFGETKYEIFKTVQIPIKIGNLTTKMKIRIVKGEIPWLLGRETMEQLGLVLDLNEEEIFFKTIKGSRIKCYTDKNGHLRVPLFNRKIKKYQKVWMVGHSNNEEGNWTRKAKKLHLQFAHGSAEKLKSLVTDSYKNKMAEEELKKFIESIEEVCRTCDICLRYKRTPARPVVGFPLSNNFNETVSMDLGELEGNKFMVMTDLATSYTQGCWIKNKSPIKILKKVAEIWIRIFGAPQRILTDCGREFQNEEMKRFCEVFGIEKISTAAESPWSNGACEKAVGLIKLGLMKLREENIMDEEIELSWTIAAKNSLNMKGGFSPNQLVFGRNPWYPNILELEDPSFIGEINQKEEHLLWKIMEAKNKAREIHIQQEASDRIRRALEKRVREHDLGQAEIGEKVFYKRNIDKRWRGPAKVVGRDGKTVIVKHDGDLREIARIHITRLQKIKDDTITMEDDKNNERDHKEEENKIKKDEEDSDYSDYDIEINAREEDEQSESESSTEEEEEQVQRREINGRERKIKVGEFYEIQKRGENETEIVKILSRAGKTSSKTYNECYNVSDTNGNRIRWINMKEYDIIDDETEAEVFLTKIEQDKVKEAKRKEIKNWTEKEVFEETPDKGQKAISTRWILKNKMINGEEEIKARLVARGFEEKEMKNQTDAPTCSPETLKMVLVIMGQNQWRMRSMDIKAAYLQGKEVEREIYLRPPKEESKGQLWKLKKTVYGLKDAARVWYESVTEILEETGGRQCKFDENIFFWREEELKGVMCIHVDDFCYGGEESFMNGVVKRIKDRLEVGSEGEKKFLFLGVNLEDDGENIKIDQLNYINRVDNGDKKRFKGNRSLEEEEMTMYRSILGKLNWMCQHTRPDIAFEVSKLSQENRGTTSDNMRKVISIVERIKSEELRINLGKMKGDYREIEVFVDASLENRKEKQTQVGYIVSITDGKRRCPIYWKSKIARRVVTSTLDAEAVGLKEAGDAAWLIKNVYEDITGKTGINIKIYTDSRNLKEAISSSHLVSDRGLRVEMAYIKQRIKRGEIKEVIWLRKEEQVADCMTKERGSKEMMKNYVSEEN